MLREIEYEKGSNSYYVFSIVWPTCWLPSNIRNERFSGSGCREHSSDFRNSKQVPFAFELSYDNNKIKANHRYNMRATIHVDGKLRFTTDAIKSVITDVENTQQADLRLVGVR